MTPQQLRAQALSASKTLPMFDAPEKICADAEITLRALVDIMNNETTLLRKGSLMEAGELAADKAELAQKYVGLARTIQSNVTELKAKVPHLLKPLQNGQAALATQMAENMRVLAVAKSLSEDIVSSVASQLGQTTQTSAYGQIGQDRTSSEPSMKGVSVNTTL
ncbi:hypothetical protein [Maritalea sp.]|uniref:hypothetical protein n=1 Tax=Maritalea sp. TaxID=2003361 RepID=UPI003EF4090E